VDMCPRHVGGRYLGEQLRRAAQHAHCNRSGGISSIREQQFSSLKGGTLVSQHLTISPGQAADRLAIRELIEAYAHCAARRDANGQMALFTPDTGFVVYMNAKDPKPSQELNSREALAPVFADLNKYAATMHYVGQTTILSLTADRGTGEAYCLAHHLTVDGEERRLMIAALRYYDTFVKIDGSWLFAERLLHVDWLEEHPQL
jgi:hypothetical protein